MARTAQCISPAFLIQILDRTFLTWGTFHKPYIQNFTIYDITEYMKFVHWSENKTCLVYCHQMVTELTGRYAEIPWQVQGV